MRTHYKMIVQQTIEASSPIATTVILKFLEIPRSEQEPVDEKATPWECAFGSL